MELIKLCAPNTPSGNPNRFYVAIENGAVVNGWCEGYKGVHAVPGWVRQACHLSVCIDVKAGEIKKFKAMVDAIRKAS
jgi:hypothetical protein